jgi:O-antigen biosynthesis protein
VSLAQLFSIRANTNGICGTVIMENGRDQHIEGMEQLPHYLALERQAADALQRADYALAFQYSDRRCRILPLPLPHCFVIRAESAWHLGRRKQALDDLDKALSIDPHDLLANRRMMAWAEDERRQTAAARLIASDKSATLLKVAIALLAQEGHQAWASTSVSESDVVGWAAWSGPAEIVAFLLEGDKSWKLSLVADPSHPLAEGNVRACAFRIARPKALRMQQVVITCNGKVFHSQQMPGVPPSPAPPMRQLTAGDLAAKGPTVIVPVYADAKATAACLDSLLASRKVEAFQLLVVDDASPNLEITRRIASLAAVGQLEVLTNTTNLGFVGSINRAIQHVTSGDVILLNSDTLVPLAFVTRLAAIADGDDNIGTVTPFSNNGEFVSFPIPNIANSLANYDEVLRFDRAAASANAGKTIEIPSGIGFCLYITRKCLNTIGRLSEEYGRGYFEDVDFCLRAKAHGFRNVCAPSLYVGHVGSRSFGQEKRALVVKNLHTLDRAFPGYRSACKAFIDADPLKHARAALERELADHATQTVLIVCMTHPFLEIAQARARQLAASGSRSCILSAHGSIFRLVASDGGLPQSIELELNTSSGIVSATRDIALFKPSHIEIIGDSAPCQLIDIAGQLRLSFDIWIVSARAPLLESFRAAARASLAPTFEAFFFASLRSSIANLKFLPIRPKPLFISPLVPGGTKTLAIVAVSATEETLLKICAILDEISSRALEYDVVIAGTTFNDSEVMSYPRTFVTGAITDENDLSDALVAYNVFAILAGFEESIFGHPKIESARNSHLPIAFIDWSRAAKQRNRDLIIPDTAENKIVAAMIANWLERGCAPG